MRDICRTCFVNHEREMTEDLKHQHDGEVLQTGGASDALLPERAAWLPGDYPAGAPLVPRAWNLQEAF